MRKKLTQAIKWLLGTAEYAWGGFGYDPEECIVLCLHSTPHAFLPQLEKTINWLKREFTILSPDDFERYCAGELKSGPYVLFTFDDGIRNNYAAAELLHRKGIHAYFFIVPSFVESANPKSYYLEHIRPIVDSSFENQPIDFEALQIAELLAMRTMGHCIGSHSSTHDLAAQMTVAQTIHEIVDSKAWLAERLNAPISAFCSPNNTNFSINAFGKKLIQEHYSYHFTTFPGPQNRPMDTHLILRRNIELNWSLGQIKFALGKWDLKRWKAAIQTYKDL
jgi:peptidoglycan/xylan/chitin deacetylase (PgdA/CDA1 family)